MVFSYNFGDKKTDETAQIQFQCMEKNCLLQNFIVWKKGLFCYIPTFTFAL